MPRGPKVFFSLNKRVYIDHYLEYYNESLPQFIGSCMFIFFSFRVFDFFLNQIGKKQNIKRFLGKRLESYPEEVALDFESLVLALPILLVVKVAFLLLCVLSHCVPS